MSNNTLLRRPALFAAAIAAQSKASKARALANAMPGFVLPASSADFAEYDADKAADAYVSRVLGLSF